jgi:hypothetical protein
VLSLIANEANSTLCLVINVGFPILMMQLITDSNHEVVCYDLFRCNTPRIFCGILLDFIAQRKLMSIFEGFISGMIESGVISPREQ